MIGEVGSGKSTLLASMLAEPEKLSGVVAVDNADQGTVIFLFLPKLRTAGGKL